MSMSPDASDRALPSPAPASPIVSPAPVEGFDSLARRISRRTTDLIVIGVIVVAGLTIAQRVLVWWKTDPADSLADPEIIFSQAALTPWGQGPEGVAIDLADQPLTLRRQMHAGTLAEAIELLRTACREEVAAEHSQLPESSPREQQLIERLRRQTAVESEPNGQWSLYEIPSPCPMTFGVRHGNAPGAADRVICWGLVLPLAEGAWSILRVGPRPSPTTGRASDSLPLPSDSEPGLSVRDDLGGQLVTFAGRGPVEGWREHFDQLAGQREWVAETAWRITPDVVSAAWTDPHGEGERIDVRFTHGDNGWTGLVNISPTRRKDHP